MLCIERVLLSSSSFCVNTNEDPCSKLLKIKPKEKKQLMKKLMLIPVFILIGLMYSCGSDPIDEPTKPIIKPTKKDSVLTYAFSDCFQIEEFNLFTGPLGTKVTDITSNLPIIERWWRKNMFGEDSAMYKPQKKMVEVNFKAKTLTRYNTKEVSFEDYIQIKNDSIFLDKDPLLFIGKLSHDSMTLSISDGFKFCFKKPILDSEKHTDKIQYKERSRRFMPYSYYEIFFKTAPFEKPEDLKRVTDTLSWMNVSYTYKKINIK